MKILVLTHEFPPVGGGGGRIARDISIGLAQRGHQVMVLTAHMEGLLRDEIMDGVCIRRVASMRREAFRAEFSEMAHYNWSALTVGLKVIREWKPDLIHAHFAVPAGAAAFALSKLTGVPYVLTTHLGDVPGAVPEKTDRWFKWIYMFTPPIWRNAIKVVASSGFTRQLALRHYPIEISIIPSAVDLKALPAHHSGNGTPRIIFAARFVAQKNPELLIQALVSLKDLRWTCTMIGDGPLLESVRKTMTDCGLAQRFSFPGWVMPEELLNAFAHSDILVMPSRSEGLSVVGVQSLGMGLALVLSDVGGNGDLVRDGENGFLFPSEDCNALTTALKKLIESPTMLQSAQQKSRELAQEFDLDVVIGQYETMFKFCLL
jgi:glycosyltransferase involved in cell wall biosynthesis